MTENSQAITIFCSKLCMGGDVRPLEPKEWGDLSELLRKSNLQPKDLLNFSIEDYKERFAFSTEYAERLLRLTDRSASIAFELSEYENMGINVVTRADEDYPVKLKKVLGNGCPPLFYYAGDLSILKNPAVGFVGSRSADAADEKFTVETVKKTASCGYGVVSGGAKGVDSFSEREALNEGVTVAEFLSDSLLKRIKQKEAVKAVQDGLLVVLSVVKPDAPFSAGVAMMRNRYIYAQSAGTVVVRADLGKGGTWTGAVDNLKHGWCKELCWDNVKYKGNAELIKMGAIPIDEGWDGDIQKIIPPDRPSQLTIF